MEADEKSDGWMEVLEMSICYHSSINSAYRAFNKRQPIHANFVGGFFSSSLSVSSVHGFIVANGHSVHAGHSLEGPGASFPPWKRTAWHTNLWLGSPTPCVVDHEATDALRVAMQADEKSEGWVKVVEDRVHAVVTKAKHSRSSVGDAAVSHGFFRVTQLPHYRFGPSPPP